MLTLLDDEAMLKLVSLKFTDSTVFCARGRRFSFNICGTDCGILWWGWKLRRHLGYFILLLQHLTSQHWVIPNGRLSLYKGGDVLQLRRPSALDNVIIFILPLDDQIIRQVANYASKVCCKACFPFNIVLKDSSSRIQLLRKVHKSNIVTIGQLGT